MAINFPDSPSTNQVFTFGNKSWKYNGTSWVGDFQSNIDADTVDGINSTQFVRSDASDTITGNNVLSFGPNSSWGATLKIGGNGNAGGNGDQGADAQVCVTNGNLHIDAKDGGHGVYHNWYAGGHNGTYFGNGSGGQVARIESNGNFTTSGTINATGQISTTKFRGTVTGGTSGDVNQPFALGQDTSSWAIIFGPSWTSNNGWGIFWAGDTNAQYRYFSSSNPNECVFVGAGNTRASIDLDNGNAYFQGNVTAASDIRLKTKIRPIDGALSIVAALKGKRYVKDGIEQVGLIAQDVEQVLPEVVTTAETEEGIKSVSYSNIVAVLVEAIKEQQQRIEALEERLDANTA